MSVTNGFKQWCHYYTSCFSSGDSVIPRKPWQILLSLASAVTLSDVRELHLLKHGGQGNVPGVGEWAATGQLHSSRYRLGGWAVDRDFVLRNNGISHPFSSEQQGCRGSHSNGTDIVLASLGAGYQLENPRDGNLRPQAHTKIPPTCWILFRDLLTLIIIATIPVCFLNHRHCPRHLT